jgi:hypothetical protein
MVLTPSFWGVSAYRHETVWTWTHIMVLTPSVWGVSVYCHETIWTWTHIMVLTPSPEVSPSVVIRRSKLGLISWSSYLLSEVSTPVVMRRSDLRLISWSSHILLRCLRLSSWDGLNLDSYHGLHTFSWDVSACRHKTVWTWTHIMVLTPSIWGVFSCRHETIWSWTHIMVLTTSPEVSPSVVMRRSKLGLIS